MINRLLILCMLCATSILPSSGQGTPTSDTTGINSADNPKGDPKALLQKANTLYKQGNFQEAIRYYKTVLNQGYEAASLYYNLGNAHYQTGRIAAAILNYERAKKLAPGNEDIRHNLRIANLQTPDKVEETPEIFLVEWWRKNIGNISPNSWAWASIWMVWIALALGLLFIFSQGGLQKLGFFGGFITLILSLLFVVGSVLKYQQMQEESHGIVFAENAYVKSSPDSESTDVFIVHKGLKVELLKEEGKWQQIQLKDGKVGWLKEKAVEVI